MGRSIEVTDDLGMDPRIGAQRWLDLRLYEHDARLTSRSAPHTEIVFQSRCHVRPPPIAADPAPVTAATNRSGIRIAAFAEHPDDR